MIHSTLNPKLFDKLLIQGKTIYSLNPQVREKLLAVSQAFLDYIQESGITILPVDVQFVGSNASYDYNDMSDIDIHIIADFDAISCDSNLLQIALNSEKHQFNSTYDITVKGMEVELYVENINESAISDGVYSLVRDRWITYPKYEKVDLPDINEPVAKLVAIASKLLQSGDAEKIQEFINTLYLIRQDGLKIGGKYSKGNLVFKEIRNLGILDKLKDHRNAILSHELTLEKLIRGSDI